MFIYCQLKAIISSNFVVSDCRKTCNVPQIGLGVLNNSTCTCNCQYGMGPNCDGESLRTVFLSLVRDTSVGPGVGSNFHYQYIH